MAVFLYLANNQRHRRAQIGRVFRDRTNPLDTLNDEEIRSRYRLDRPRILSLCELLTPHLTRPTNRSQALPVSLQVMTALRYFATGTFFSLSGDVHGVTKMSVSRCVHPVAAALCQYRNRFITFPMSEMHQRQVKADFYEIANFPNVLGSIDGTLIPIKGPSTDEHLYVSRKGFHALNVQVVNDAKLKITNLVVKWPGSTHDSFIWNLSSLKDDFVGGVIDSGWLLGDNGYACSHRLLTPVINPQSQAERKYNASQKKSRNTSERTIGVWKMRFLCLHKYGGTMMFVPERYVDYYPSLSHLKL